MGARNGKRGAPAQPPSATKVTRQASLEATACSYGEAYRVDGRTAVEGFGAEAQQGLEDAVPRAAALDANGGREARASGAQPLEVLAEDVAGGGLQRAIQPDPDRPRVAQ